MSSTESAADNGVNVQALLDARTALIDAPEAAKFKWRASTEWVRGTRTRDDRSRSSPASAQTTATSSFTYTADHPEVFASEDNGPTPVEFVLVGLATCLTAGVAAVAQNRDIQLNSVKATSRATWTSSASSAATPTSQRLQRHQRPLRHRRRRRPGRHRGHRRPVAEALGGVRRRHEPVERQRQRQLIARPR